MSTDHLNFTEWILRSADLINSIDDPDRLPQRLATVLKSLVPCTHAWAGGFGSYRFIDTNEDGRAADPSLRGYTEGGYLLDPYFELFREGRSGCFPLRRVMPDGFDETEFFEKFYRRHGYIDDLVHMTQIEGRGAVVVGAVRSIEEGVFSDAEIALHDAVHPYVAACSKRLSRFNDVEGVGPVGIHPDALDRALQNFGKGLLTPREQQVVGLVLHGHNTESIANRLGITADTVKLHRKHAYAKFQVNSQGELFYKFLESLGLSA